jgi:hypothetical protein
MKVHEVHKVDDFKQFAAGFFSLLDLPISNPEGE